MKRRRYSEEQIIGILKESEAGGKNQEVCRKHGISEQTFYRWRSKYGGLQVSEARRLKDLETENRKLKQLLAEAHLAYPNLSLQKVNSKVRSDVERVLTEIAQNEQMRWKKRKGWTSEIMQKLADVVQSPPYDCIYVFAKNIKSNKQKTSWHGEWLYDLCWLQYDDNDDSEHILRMPLALECEWGTDIDILEDFQKLLLSRAALRVMVFGENNESTEKTVQILKEQIKSYRDGSPDDCYLLVGFEKWPRIKFSFIDGTGTQLA